MTLLSVGVRVSGNPAGGNGLFYMHSDHPSTSPGTSLGSNSVMSYGQGHTANPVGTAAPTAVLTDHGYTGHKHNNLGGAADDLGLIFMNARYYDN